MRMPAGTARRGIYFEGFLSRAGLKDGPLGVNPEPGASNRWIGTKPVFATVRITAHYRDGSRARATRRVGLAPGWG
jgi:hypothetical protein